MCSSSQGPVLSGIVNIAGGMLGGIGGVLASQCALSTMGNEFNPVKGIEQMLTKDGLKSTGINIITSYVIGNAPGINAPLKQFVKYSAQKAILNANLQIAIGGAKAEDAFTNAGVNLAFDVVGRVGANQIGSLYGKGEIGYAVHKGLHGILGAGFGAMKGDPVAGALGGMVGEMVAEYMVGDPQQVADRVVQRVKQEGILPNKATLDGLIQQELEPAKNWGKLGAVVAAGLADRDVNVGFDVANNAIENNLAIGIAARVLAPVLVQVLRGSGAVLVAKGASDLANKSKEDQKTQQMAMDAHPEEAQWVDEGFDAEELKAKPLITPMPGVLPPLEGYQPGGIPIDNEGYEIYDGPDLNILENLNIRPGQEWKEKIQGRAQATQTPGHGLESLKAAIKGAKDPLSGDVYLDNGYHKALRKLGVDVKLQSNRRPDVLIVSKDGKSMQAIEIQSKSDREKVLKHRNENVGRQLEANGIDLDVKVNQIPSWDYANGKPKK